MNSFLDPNSRKKLKLLTTIFQSENNTISRSDLLEKLKISGPTLLHMINEIKEDFIRFECQKKVLVFYNSKQLLFHIEMQEDFSLQYLELFYLEESLKFNLVIDLLTNEISDLSSAADKYYVSYISITREIKYLKEYFSKRGITLVTRGKKLYLDGNELSIRIFYSYFFLNTYGGQKWPFKFVSFKDISKIVDALPREIYQHKITEKTLVLHYYFAISLLRIRRQVSLAFDIGSTILYEPFTQSQKENYDRFISVFTSYLPSSTEDQILIEAALSASTIVSMGSYESIEKSPSFFYLNPKLQEMKFMDYIFNLIDRLEFFSIKPLDSQEYNRLVYQMCTIHYRILLFKKDLLIDIPLWNNESAVERTLRKTRMIAIQNRLYKELPFYLPEILAPYLDYLVDQYSKSIDVTLSDPLYNPKINILLLSKNSTHNIRTRFLDFYSTFLHINLVDNLDENVDLVISDIIISNDVINISSKTKIIYVNSKLSQRDFKNISEVISEISTKKLSYYSKQINTTE